ncbi:MAG: hypothetical protein WEF28_12210 [Acidimicrobiia bacterium]
MGFWYRVEVIDLLTDHDAIEELFAHVYEFVEKNTPEPADHPTWKLRTNQRADIRRPLAMVVLALGGLVTFVAIGMAVRDSGVATNILDVPTPTTSPPGDPTEIPPAVTSYWSLEGELAAYGTDRPWVCPAGPTDGFSNDLPVALAPRELQVILTPLEPSQIRVQDYGPHCYQPPLVELASSDGTRSFVAYPVLNSSAPCQTCQDGALQADVSIGGVPGVVHTNVPDQSISIIWTTPRGLRIAAFARGLEIDEAVAMARQIEIDENGEFAETDLAASLELQLLKPLSARPGEWISDVSISQEVVVEANSIQVTTRRDPSFSVFGFPSAQIVEMADGGSAAWLADAGGFLFFQLDSGVVVSVEGARGLPRALLIGESIAAGDRGQ